MPQLEAVGNNGGGGGFPLAECQGGEFVFCFLQEMIRHCYCHFVSLSYLSFSCH